MFYAMVLVMFGLVAVFSVVGNSVVIWTVWVHSHMRTPTNFYLANLAIADVLMGGITVPIRLHDAWTQRTLLPAFICNAVQFVEVLSVFVSVYTLVILCRHRYRGVKYPLRLQVTSFKSLCKIALTWMFGCGFALLKAWDYEVKIVRNRPSGVKPVCVESWMTVEWRDVYTIFLTFILYLIPLCIIAYTNRKIIKELRWGQTPGNASVKRDKYLQEMKKTATDRLNLVVVLFAITWLPIHSYYLILIRFPELSFYCHIDKVWYVSYLAAMVNSFMNPLVYVIYSRKFHERLSTSFQSFRSIRSSERRQNARIEMPEQHEEWV